MIYVVTGAPCAGKSTYVKEHAQAGDVLIDFDSIAEAFGSPVEHEHKGAVREIAFAARTAAVERALQGVESDVWIVHTAPSERHLSLYAAARAEIVSVDPGESVCLSRAAAEDRPEGTVDAIADFYAQKSFMLRLNASSLFR